MDNSPLSERAEALRAAIKTLEMCHKTLELTLAIIAAPAPAPVPKPTDQEQQILDLFAVHDGPLVGSVIAQLLGNDGDNGTVKRRLAEMTRKGLLRNLNPGYLPASA